ncbi:unnamed protein product [Colias eurytheme]|nr:unnamed protein product [Colias eurytheme]
MAYDRVLRKLTVCRHWTLDRLPARGAIRTRARVSFVKTWQSVSQWHRTRFLTTDSQILVRYPLRANHFKIMLISS